MECSSSHRKQRSQDVRWMFRREEGGELSMKASTNPSPKEKSASQQIDAIIKEPGDWRGKKLSQLRAVIKKADPAVVEEVKWKKPSRPEGVPVWSHNGNICIADTLKNAVRLTFPKGAQIKDPKKLFNTRLDSNTVRATERRSGEPSTVTAPREGRISPAMARSSVDFPAPLSPSTR